MAHELQALVRGVVLVGDEDRHGVASDFGRVSSQRPALVVRPTTADDVATVLHYASERDIPVSVRATAHSQGGQALGPGISLDLTALARLINVDPDGDALLVETGTTWHAITHVLRAGGKLPPVLTDNLSVSVGGVLASGGLGPASFRYGPQAASCTRLEVVTAAGDVCWCSEEENRQLFDYARCGLGRFVVTTKVEHPLLPMPAELEVYESRYHEVDDFLDVVRAASDDPAVRQLGGRVARDRDTGARVYDLLIAWGAEEPPETVKRTDRGATQRIDTHDYFLRFHDMFVQWKRAAEGGIRTHPWVEAFVPMDGVAACVGAMIELLPGDVLDNAQTLLWPIRRCDIPMMAMPEGDLCMLIGFLPNPSPSDLPATLDHCRRLDALFVTHGGKRYLSGWVDYDIDAWREHFGQAWGAINEAKRTLDPRDILGSGFFAFESPSHDPSSHGGEVPARDN